MRLWARGKRLLQDLIPHRYNLERGDLAGLGVAPASRGLSDVGALATASRDEMGWSCDKNVAGLTFAWSRGRSSGGGYMRHRMQRCDGWDATKTVNWQTRPRLARGDLNCLPRRRAPKAQITVPCNSYYSHDPSTINTQNVLVAHWPSKATLPRTVRVR